MGFVSWNTFVFSFKVVCTLATVFMIGFWILKYQKNEDVSVIEYKEIDEFESFVLPEVSICLLSPFLAHKLMEIDRNTSVCNYVKYLRGSQTVAESYQKIAFYNVTLDLFEHLTHYNIRMRDENKTKPYLLCPTRQKCPFVKFKNSFNGFWMDAFYRCFGVEIKKHFTKKIKELDLYFNSLSLANSLTEIQESIGLQTVVSVTFNYPQQMLKASEVRKNIWNQPNENRVYTQFKITSMEVLKRRNKRNAPCLLDWMHFDDVVLKKHLEGVGCRAPYLNSDTPQCTSKEKMSESLYEMTKVRRKYVPAPCQEMSNIESTFEPLEFLNENQLNNTTPTNILNLKIVYPNRIKRVTQSQSIDIQALIGNIGGYLGLFLGKV